MSADAGADSGGAAGLYRELILEHSRQRHGYGLEPDAAVESHQLNPTCGDEITLQVRFDEASGRVTGIGWEGQGCAISTASASVLADIAHGSPDRLNELVEAFREMLHSKGNAEPDEELLGDAVALQGVSRYVARVKCAMLPWVALEDALRRLPPALPQGSSPTP